MICRVCDASNLEPVIDLGDQPWCNHFLKKEQVGREPFYPLRVTFCQDCRTPQLDYTVPKEVMFGDHTYLSGSTKTLSDHFLSVAQDVDRDLFAHVKPKSIMDIGGNDGTNLKHYKELGWDVLNVEPSTTAVNIAREQGVETAQEFFNLAFVRNLGRKFHAIHASGVFFHLEELHSATDGIREALRVDGVFVVQFLYMKRIVENNAFDQIYHEHLLYYNLHNIEVLLNRHGLAMFDARVSPIHGGSVIGYVGHAGKRPPSARLQALREDERRCESNEITTYHAFHERIREMKVANRSFLEAAKVKGKRVFGMGAPVKGNTLLNYFRVGPDLIEALVERNPLRRNMWSPGMHIPVWIEDEVKQSPDIWYVLAWNFKKEILQRYQEQVRAGIEFYFPVNPKES